jgi:hypothetical protein
MRRVAMTVLTWKQLADQIARLSPQQKKELASGIDWTAGAFRLRLMTSPNLYFHSEPFSSPPSAEEPKHVWGDIERLITGDHLYEQDRPIVIDNLACVPRELRIDTDEDRTPYLDISDRFYQRAKPAFKKKSKPVIQEKPEVVPVPIESTTSDIFTWGDLINFCLVNREVTTENSWCDGFRDEPGRLCPRLRRYTLGFSTADHQLVLHPQESTNGFSWQDMAQAIKAHCHINEQCRIDGLSEDPVAGSYLDITTEAVMRKVLDSASAYGNGLSLTRSKMKSTAMVLYTCMKGIN